MLMRLALLDYDAANMKGDPRREKRRPLILKKRRNFVIK